MPDDSGVDLDKIDAEYQAELLTCRWCALWKQGANKSTLGVCERLTFDEFYEDEIQVKLREGTNHLYTPDNSTEISAKEIVTPAWFGCNQHKSRYG